MLILLFGPLQLSPTFLQHFLLTKKTSRKNLRCSGSWLLLLLILSWCLVSLSIIFWDNFPFWILLVVSLVIFGFISQRHRYFHRFVSWFSCFAKEVLKSSHFFKYFVFFSEHILLKFWIWHGPFCTFSNVRSDFILLSVFLHLVLLFLLPDYVKSLMFIYALSISLFLLLISLRF